MYDTVLILVDAYQARSIIFLYVRVLYNSAACKNNLFLSFKCSRTKMVMVDELSNRRSIRSTTRKVKKREKTRFRIPSDRVIMDEWKNGIVK